jgi:hypothetical protein
MPPAALRLILPASLLALGLACGGGEPCTEIGCADEGLTLAFDRDVWEDGVWSFSFDVDGVAQSCDVTFPIGEIDGLYCGSGQVKITLDPASQAVVSAYVDGEELTSVTVTVAFNGTEVASTAITPEYETTYPNGPGCPPGCKHADAALAL